MEYEKKSKRGLITFLIILIFVMLLVGSLAGYLFIQKNRGVYLGRTTVNGYDVAGLNTEQAGALLTEQFSNVTFTLSEAGVPILSGSLKDLGYSVNEEGLKNNLRTAMEIQNGTLKDLLISLFGVRHFVMDVPFDIDEAVYSERVKTSILPGERKPSTDARLKKKKKTGFFVIVPETYGNTMTDERLRESVKNQINAQLANSGEDISGFASLNLTIGENEYEKPTVLSNDPLLNQKLTVYNRYCNASITYTFGSQTQVLDWETIGDWIVLTDTDGYLNEDLVYDYVVGLEAKYNTRYQDRTFYTSTGRTVTIEGAWNEYGYVINEPEEYARLLADIYANQPVEREPVYFTQSSEYGNPAFYYREGTDDLAGTYVEVDLTGQHLWFYKFGVLIVSTDIVSGCVAKGAETVTGCFPLAYKESPSVLQGADAEDGYRTEVQYWMPFYEGQGLHDAGWRGSFGGSIYLESGSHGCVNMPPWAAAEVYQSIEPGTAIILYK